LERLPKNGFEGLPFRASWQHRKVKVGWDVADSWNMAQNISGKVTLQDLKPHGLLDLYRQGTSWVASIRLKNGRLTNLPLEPTVITRKAALQFLKAELEKSYSNGSEFAVPGSKF
jgi:hypothetical protein